MTRRIILAILALICALLATVVVPLGLITAAHDRHDYQNQALATARSLASAAEEKLADHDRGTALAAAISQLRGSGDRVAIVGPAGALIAGTALPAAAGQIRRALAAGPAPSGRPAARCSRSPRCAATQGAPCWARWRWPARPARSATGWRCSGPGLARCHWPAWPRARWWRSPWPAGSAARSARCRPPPGNSATAPWGPGRSAQRPQRGAHAGGQLQHDGRTP